MFSTKNAIWWRVEDKDSYWSSLRLINTLGFSGTRALLCVSLSCLADWLQSSRNMCSEALVRINLTSKPSYTTICSEDVAETHRGSLIVDPVSVKPCLVMGHVLVVSLTQLDPTILPPLLPHGFQSSTYVCLWLSLHLLLSLPNETFLMMITLFLFLIVTF